MQNNIINNPKNESYNDRINKIYNSYLNTICPFIAAYERLENKFPVSILNEVRALTTHLARVSLSDKESVIEDNIAKAERHIKRCILDCYKYLCMAYEHAYKSFENFYKNVDLSTVDNGDFLQKLAALRNKSLSALEKAQILELKDDADDEKIFNEYESAYNCYADTYNYINDSRINLTKAKHRASRKTVFSIISFIVGVLGLVVGIAGVTITVLLSH